MCMYCKNSTTLNVISVEKNIIQTKLLNALN